MRIGARASFFVAILAAAVAPLHATAGAQAASGQRTGPTTSAAAPAADSAEVARVVGQYHEALGRGDSTAALGLLAPDAVILESGGMETVAEYRAHHLSSDIEFARAIPERRSAIGVAVRGDVAWAASTSTAKGTFRGRTIDSSGAELMVLTRTPGGWRIAAIHWSSRRN